MNVTAHSRCGKDLRSASHIHNRSVSPGQTQRSARSAHCRVHALELGMRCPSSDSTSGTPRNLDLPTHEVGKRQRAAAIRYMDHIDACHKLEQLTGDMRHGAVTGPA